MDMDELGFFLFMEEQERKKREQEEREATEWERYRQELCAN